MRHRRGAAAASAPRVSRSVDPVVSGLMLLLHDLTRVAGEILNTLDLFVYCFGRNRYATEFFVFISFPLFIVPYFCYKDGSLR